jgi:hypothetical protein
VNVNSCFSISREIFVILVTLDMYRMLQAVERQPNESTLSLDDRATTQSPANHQREIFVRIFIALQGALYSKT